MTCSEIVKKDLIEIARTFTRRTIHPDVQSRRADLLTDIRSLRKKGLLSLA